MNNKFKEMDMKNHKYYFFDDMINIKNLDPNKIKIDENSYKIILIYYIGHVMIKDLNHVEIDSLNPLYLIINKINGYIEESNGNEYLTLVPTDERKDTIKNMKNLGIKSEIVLDQ